MTLEYHLPPAFSLHEIGQDEDPLARAVTDATANVEDGAFYLAVRPDQARFSVVVVPEASLARSLPVLAVAMTAMSDALGTVIPPAIGVNFGWPGDIYIDGALAGRMRAAADLTRAEAPRWIVLSFDITILGAADQAPRASFETTSLAEQGAGYVTPPELAEAYARYFLTWVRRWQDDGLAPVQEHWNERAHDKSDRIDASARCKKAPTLRQFVDNAL